MFEIKEPHTFTDKEWKSYEKTLLKYIFEKRMREKAHAAVAQALKDGRLKPPKKCENCERPSKHRLQPHHHSYYPSTWLKVKWLCPRCHGHADQAYYPSYKEYEDYLSKQTKDWRDYLAEKAQRRKQCQLQPQ
ncbi:hypothetical protein ES708_15226 [subsurface metagenome]